MLKLISVARQWFAKLGFCIYVSLFNSALSTDPSTEVTNKVIESQNVGFHQHLSALCFRNIIQENEYMNAYVFPSTAMKHVASEKTHEECQLKF